jgi:osmotically-inducible protein OsmY
LAAGKLPKQYQRKLAMNLHNRFYLTFFLFSLSSALAGCSSYGKCVSGACGGDAVITMNVQTLLDQHAELGAPHSIEVQTIDRVVFLNGFVSDGLERGISESVALQSPGVLKVVNSIAVQK